MPAILSVSSGSSSLTSRRLVLRRRSCQQLSTFRSGWILYPTLVLLIAGLPQAAHAQQQSFTWQQIRDNFEATNPTLLADKLNIDESTAQEITAYLRPNPTFSLTSDGTQIASDKGVWRPFAGTFESPGISYLHERQHKRELRLESAKKGTLIGESSHADLVANHTFYGSKAIQRYGYYLRYLAGKTHGRYLEVGGRQKKVPGSVDRLSESILAHDRVP